MSHAHAHAAEPRALCPFCAAPWSDAMLDALARYTGSSSCACCGGDPAHAVEPAEVPTADLCCDSCSRAIYLAPARS